MEAIGFLLFCCAVGYLLFWTVVNEKNDPEDGTLGWFAIKPAAEEDAEYQQRFRRPGSAER